MLEHNVCNNVDLQSITICSSGYMSIKDIKGVYIACNDKQAQLLGFSSGFDVLGKSDVEIPRLRIKLKEIRKTERLVIHKKSVLVSEETMLVGARVIQLLNQKAPLLDT